MKILLTYLFFKIFMVFSQNFEQWQCSGVRAGQCRRALTTKYFRFELGMVGHVTAPAGAGVL